MAKLTDLLLMLTGGSTISIAKLKETMDISAGGSLAVTDGDTTVDPASTLHLVNGNPGATVSVVDDGEGAARIIIGANVTGDANQILVADGDGGISTYDPEYPRLVSGTTDILLAADNGKGIQYSSGASVTVTVPAGLGAFQCFAIQTGSGQVNFVGDDGVTIENWQDQFWTKSLWAEVSLTSLETNLYVLAGVTGPEPT